MPVVQTKIAGKDPKVLEKGQRTQKRKKVKSRSGEQKYRREMRRQK